MFKSYCTVDLLPLGSYDERILLPYDLALGNRLLRDEAFTFFPIKIFDLDGCRPSGDVETLDECERWKHMCRLTRGSRPARGGTSGRFECLLCEGTVRVQTFQDSSQTFFAHSPQRVLGK